MIRHAARTPCSEMQKRACMDTAYARSSLLPSMSCPTKGKTERGVNFRLSVFPSLAKQISIVELKELAHKRPESDPIRQIILASDDHLDSSGYANLVRIVLRLMKQEGEGSLQGKTSPKLSMTGGSNSA